MATSTSDKSKVMLRMSDLTSEPKRMLPPIKGYEKEPLVSIDQAIQPIISVVADIEEMVWTVKQNCQEPRDKLSLDEMASIMLYTLEWTPSESSFYYILNKTLRSQNRNELLPWFRYLRLFMFALSKVQSTLHRMVYRGIKMDISAEFPDGKTFIWWAFSSATSSIKVLEQFLGTTGHRTIFNIECDSAKDISRYSFYESENEILMYPARQFQVISTFNSGNQLKIVHLKEIQPPFALIHIPQSPSITADEKPKETVAHAPSYHIPDTYSAKPEFAAPGVFKEQGCKGRLCATCGKCRDWYYTGDVADLSWMRGAKNWSNSDKQNYRDNKIWQRFKKRTDGATCNHGHHLHLYYLGAHGGHYACLCDDNVRG